MPFDGLSTDSKVLDVLHLMRDALSQPGGWVQGGVYPHGGDCLVVSAQRHGGLLDDTVIGHLADNLPWRLRRLLWRLRRWPPLSDRHSLINYNDNPRTTADAVVALIDRTIASL